MPGGGGAEGKGSPQVRFGQIRIVGEDVGLRHATGKQVQDVHHPDPRSPDVRSSPANRRVDAYAIGKLSSRAVPVLQEGAGNADARIAARTGMPVDRKEAVQRGVECGAKVSVMRDHLEPALQHVLG